MAWIDLKKLTKDYERFRAVDGIDLAIADGEFMVFVGPSGCGKTTTLKMISGLESPTSGEILINGTVVNDVEPADRDLGMVFQSLALFPHMNVFDNIAFGLRIKKVREPEVRERVLRAGEAMKISELVSKRPSQLSGGEAQRVALARTIVNNPTVFLMDEPLSSLDAKLRVEMRSELKLLHKNLRTTFVYVTHDQAEAMTMADRITVMRSGRIQQVGDPLSIYNDPVNMFTASFFGIPSMNFIHGSLETAEGSLRFRADQLSFSLSGFGNPARLAGRAVYLGVRPENIRLAESGVAVGEVSLVEPLGSETLLHIAYSGGEDLITKVESSHAAKSGDRVGFDFRDDGVVLFDAQSGGRIRPDGD